MLQYIYFCILSLLISSAVTGPHRELVLEQKVDQVKNMGFDEVCTSLRWRFNFHLLNIGNHSNYIAFEQVCH